MPLAAEDLAGFDEHGYKPISLAVHCLPLLQLLLLYAFAAVPVIC